jgi:hypothetical protein
MYVYNTRIKNNETVLVIFEQKAQEKETHFFGMLCISISNLDCKNI